MSKNLKVIMVEAQMEKKLCLAHLLEVPRSENEHTELIKDALGWSFWV